jgi:hypothetical protein
MSDLCGWLEGLSSNWGGKGRLLQLGGCAGGAACVLTGRANLGDSSGGAGGLLTGQANLGGWPRGAWVQQPGRLCWLSGVSELQDFRLKT